MGNIVLLDDLTINQIAAGEVIERPASVVKELVENSIDAGATSVSIEVKNGGISYIRVTDNGKGIMPDDMEIAFERHATSKIRHAKDLETVKSMGFRGEALASIAAIARVEMISKTAENSVGYKIVVEGGNIISKEEIGCPKGTSITVENLFFNTPVRYKFLKKDFTEFGYIEDTITRIALINSNISIKLINSGKTIIQTSGNNDIKAVLYSIYGKDISQNSLEVNYTYEDICVTGVIGKPDIARSNRSNQLFFVNKRHVKDKTLTSAADQAFKGMIPIGKFGFLVLNLEIDSHKVDVNVHPAKLEVRFEEDSKVFKAVYHAIKENLLKNNFENKNDKNETQSFINNSVGVQNQSFQSVKGVEVKQNEPINTLFGGFFKKIINHQNKNEVVTKLDSKPQITDIKLKSNTSKEESCTNQKYELNKISEPENVVNKQELEIKEKLASFEKLVNVENLSSNKESIINLNKEVRNTDNDSINSKGYETKNSDNIIENKFNETNHIENRAKSNDYKVNNNENQNLNKDFEIRNSENKIDIDNKKVNENADIPLFHDKELMCEKSINGEISIQDIEESSSSENKLNNIIEKVHNLENNKIEEDSSNFEEMYARMFGKLPREDAKIEEQNVIKEDAIEYHFDEKDLENIDLFSNIDTNNIPNYRFIGLAFGAYIIIEMDKEMYIIDSISAHERIIYEKIKKNYYNNGPKQSQLMLLPDIISLNHKEMGIAKDNIELFEKAGFTLEEFGENTIKLTGVPDFCVELDTKKIFLETLDEINTVARTAKQEIEEKLISTLACKTTEKLNISLDSEKIDEILRDLLILPDAFMGINGCHIGIRMSKAEIEKRFSRRK